uniref:RNA-directed RNA polymerase n=1 Tax=Mackintosh virus TaxID=2707237 RepID=A0A6H0DIN4_9VIRU|nr:MAG: RNA-dependent RNA polymerase [Mackintosh virus]
MESSTLGSMLGHFDQAVEEIKALNLTPLGAGFNSLSIGDLRNALVAHRATKKYEVPLAAAANLRKEYSISEVLNHDKHGLDSFDYRTLQPKHRRQFLMSQAWLRDFFTGFKHTYQLRFPTGESLVSARGATDLFYKLTHTKQWVISPDLVDYAVEILVRSRALKRIVIGRFRDTHASNGMLTLRRLRGDFLRMGHKASQWPKMAIKFMFRSVVTLHRASRVTVVPKDNSRDRVITCEALWTMICQLSYSSSLRDHMVSKLGIDLDFWQSVHRSLIRAGGATIDLSKASDSNYMCVLRAMWPKNQYRTLEIMRTGLFLIDGTYTPLKMFAPMGTGCTFEVMTLTLLASVRSYDPGGTVFGDDIIIKTSDSELSCFTSYLESMGWKINHQKSFTDGYFRESCGAFCDLRTDEFLVSYDFVRPTTLSECFTLAHKVLIVGNVVTGPLRKILVDLYTRLILIAPRDSMRVPIKYETQHGANLTDSVLFVPESIFSCVAKVSGKAAQVLSQLWQRPVHVNRITFIESVVTKSPKVINDVLYACYMRRGVYDVPSGRFKTRQIPCDLQTSVPIGAVSLFSVII